MLLRQPSHLCGYVKKRPTFSASDMKTMYNRLEEYGPYEGPRGNQAVAPKWGEAHDGVMLITELRLSASVPPFTPLIGWGVQVWPLSCH